MNPQPRTPTEGENAGVPMCQASCPHYLDYEYGEECELGGIAGDSCIPCLPAVRQMAVKLRNHREQLWALHDEMVTCDEWHGGKWHCVFCGGIQRIGSAAEYRHSPECPYSEKLEEPQA